MFLRSLWILVVLPGVIGLRLEAQHSTTSQSPGIVIGVFRGVLPCADCRGIETELTLRAKSQYQLTGTIFTLKQTYLGTRDGNRTFVKQGTWTMQRGMPGDINATVYQLKFGKTKQLLNFLRVSEYELKQLGQDQRMIKSELNYSLRRADLPTTGKQQLANPASVNCVKQGGKSEIRQDKKGNQYRVCIFSNGQECEEWALLRGECSVTHGKSQPE